MKRKNHSRRRDKSWLAAIILVTFLTITLFSAPVLADSKQEASLLIIKARYMIENFMFDPNLEGFRDLIKKARAVLLVPDLVKGAFIVGASGGNGMLLVSDPKTGTWDGPAFYTVGGASFGLQIGGSASDTAILVMTDRGITSLMGTSVKLGGDLGIAAGPIGLGVSASTANLSVDLISFSRSRGLYGGVSLDGSVVAVRDDLNEAFYNKKVTPTDIFIRHNVAKNPEANILIDELVKAAKK